MSIYRTSYICSTFLTDAFLAALAGWPTHLLLQKASEAGNLTALYLPLVAVISATLEFGHKK